MNRCFSNLDVTAVLSDITKEMCVTRLDLLTLTLDACGVQGEAFGTFTVEASRGVDAGRPGATHTVLG